VSNTDTIRARLRLGGVTGTALALGTAIDAVNGMIFGGQGESTARSIGFAGPIVAIGAQVLAPAAGTAMQDNAVAFGSTAESDRPSMRALINSA
jgi:hypothetical protein